MDKRSLTGRHYKKLDLNQKKLFLLEGLYDCVKENNSTDIILRRQNKILCHIAKTQVKMMQIQNKNTVWNEDYIKQLLQEIDNL